MTAALVIVIQASHPHLQESMTLEGEEGLTCTIIHAAAHTLLAGLPADLDCDSCSAGVVRWRGVGEQRSVEEKSKNQRRILSSVARIRYPISFGDNNDGSGQRDGFNSLFEMFGNHVGYVPSHGPSGLFTRLDSQNYVAQRLDSAISQLLVPESALDGGRSRLGKEGIQAGSCLYRLCS